MRLSPNNRNIEGLEDNFKKERDMKRIPFDLEKAKAGANIVTRDGAVVEMNIFHDGYFLGTFETEEHGKLSCAWNNNGKTYNTTPNKPYYLDLELLVEE